MQRFRTSLHRPVAYVVPVLLGVALAACGGGTATSAPGGTSGAGATIAPGGTTAPAATGAAATAAATAGTGEAGEGATGATQWCLNTVEEVSMAVGVSVATAAGTDNAGAGGGCIYSDAAGAVVYSVAVVTIDGYQQTYEAGKQTQGVVEVSGIGNGALLMSPQGPLVILTDKGLISLGPTTPDLMGDAAGYRTAAEALGRQAVGRVP